MKKKKYTIILLLAIAVIFAAIFGYRYFTSVSYQLEAKGYTEDEITIFKRTVSDTDMTVLFKEKKSNEVLQIVKSKYYQKDKLKSYLDFYDRHKLSNGAYAVAAVNENIEKKNGYKESLINRYMAYLDNNTVPLEQVIATVNLNIDQDKNGSIHVLRLWKEPYFIKDNLSRYYNFYKKNLDMNTNELIKEVNSNLDYAFYTNVTKTDLSKNERMIVNKYHRLDENYKPDNLVQIEPGDYALKVVADNYHAMKTEASKYDCDLTITSAYRSYQTQSSIYNSYINQHGQVWADNYSAKPGYSEHQTGLALDITSNSSNFDTFEDTTEFKWLKKNAHLYGFILRYQRGEEYVTGYSYEPWHYRYVGTALATELFEKGITYEEYYAYYLK